MATAKEKLFASFITKMMAELHENGMAFSDELSEMELEIQSVLDEETEENCAVKKTKGMDDRFFYTGLKALDMTQDERDELGFCEFTVTYHNEVILDIFWDSTLTWIMQPMPDGTLFPACERKFPGRAFSRSFLKKLADEELENKGAFAKKYYKQRPTAVIIRKQQTTDGEV